MKSDSRREFMAATGRYALYCFGVAPLFSAIISGCEGMDQAATIGASLGQATGVISGQQAESIIKSGQAVARGFQDITPEQEYYIGRAVGASLLTQYPPFENRAANVYVNTLGQALAQVSDLPETFNGYHFLVLNSKEINAFAAPGGLVFVTRGMLRCCRNEDALAAVLAHEIGHVEHRHGLQAIKKSRVTAALSTLALEGAKNLGGQELAKLTRTFESSITDITATLVNSGYSLEFEKQADNSAVTILQRIGYDPNGLVDMLRQMKIRLAPGSPGFGRTHPTPAVRIADVQGRTGAFKPVPVRTVRQARFERLMGAV
ncbi:MAG: M48 family metalloprotease [Desulfobacterales bacterium]|nr:M48 family metalloprotease [Desulfobacterales bacterium]